MDTVRTIGLLSVAVVATAAIGIGTTHATVFEPPVADLPEPVVETVDPPGIYGADDAFAALIERSIDRFENAGLRLPPLRIYAHDATDACGGHTGQFGHDGDERRIDLCAGSSHTAIVLHELAHAWEHHNVSEATRQAFLDATGLVWYDANLPWRERGIERLATTIAWGLLDTGLSEDRVEESADLIGLFELLTGRATPRL